MKAIIRSIKDSDHPFILSTWLRSYYDLMTGFKAPQFIYFKNHQEIIKEVLSTKEGVVLCNDEDEDQIIGYMISTGDVLHYIYVKNIFRNLKFAKKMLSIKKMTTYTHHTSYISKMKLSMIYNPYLFKEGKYDKAKDSQDSTIH